MKDEKNIVEKTWNGKKGVSYFKTFFYLENHRILVLERTPGDDSIQGFSKI